jgi:hypothetical protein
MFFLNIDADSQCAMCRQTAESASQGGNQGIAEGLNGGIVYLMLAPYMLLAIGAIAFFRKKIFSFFSAK